MALNLGGAAISTSLDVVVGGTSTANLASAVTGVLGGLSTAVILSQTTATSASTSTAALLPSGIQSFINNLTATSTSAQPAVTSSSLFAGLQVQVPGLPLDVGFPFLVENITPPRVNSSLFERAFSTLRTVWSPELKSVNSTGSDDAPGFTTSGLPTLEVGQPFTLFSALPQPGTVVTLPITRNSSSSTTTTSTSAASTSGSAAPTPTPNGFASNTLFTIPENAFITSKWDFYKSDDDNTFQRVTSRDYKILNGSLFSTASGSSQYVFNPSSDLSISRSIVGCLSTTIFIPDGSNRNLAAPRLCLGAKISPWTTVFGQVSSDGVVRDYPGTKGLFHVDIDTNAPLPGNPITLMVNPVDKMPLLAPRIETIVDATPDLKVTAAVDLGAPLNAVIGAGVKAITGLFNSGKADNVASKVLTVSSVLDGLLTVPLALDFKGRSVTKTLKPAADMLTQNVQALAGGLAGSLPIGSLVASIQSSADSISLPLPSGITALQQPLQGLHGLTLNILPEFIAAGNKTLPPSITIPVTLRPTIMLPGRDTPLINEIALGSITVTLPRITLPQVAMLFHDIGFATKSANDILVTLDPATYRLVSTKDQLRLVLEQLNVLVTRVQSIFRRVITDGRRLNSLDNLIETASTMLGFIERAPSDQSQGYIKIVNANLPGLGYYRFNDAGDTFNGDTAGLSSLIWLGLRGTYSFEIGFGNAQGTDRAIYMKGDVDNQFSTAIYSSESYQTVTSGICFQSSNVGSDNCENWNAASNGRSTFDNSARTMRFRKL